MTRVVKGSGNPYAEFMYGRLFSLFWLLAFLSIGGCNRAPDSPPEVPTAPTPSVQGPQVKIPDAIEAGCGGCHAVPQPGLVTQRTWAPAIDMMYSLMERYYPETKGRVDKAQVMAFYAAHAAPSLPAPRVYPPLAPDGPRFALRSLGTSPGRGPIADLRVDRDARGQSSVLMTEVLHGRIQRVAPAEMPALGDVLATARHPVRAVRADVNGDGIRDLLVAELGVFSADDTATGAVQLYPGGAKGTAPIALLERAGRVADLAVGNLGSPGRPAIIVAEFGWQKTGALHLFEPVMGADGALTHRRRSLDDRAGHVAVELADLDQDGDLDIVTALAQHHEAVEWWRNDGDGRFERASLFRAPHPFWGMIGLHVVDLDADGDLDILHYNGDVLDAPKLGVFQGVHWLENRGRGQFESRQLAQLPGVHDVDVADVDGDGRLDIVAVANLPVGIESTLVGPDATPTSDVPLESVLLLRQTQPGAFTVHSLLRDAPCFSAVLFTDGDGDGDIDVLLGGFGMGWTLLGDNQLAGGAREGTRLCEQGHLLWFENGGAADQTRTTLAMLDRQPPTLLDKVSALETITRHDPANLGYGTVLSDLLLRLGKPKEAVEQLQRLLRVNPDETVDGFLDACGPKKTPSCTDVGRLLFASRSVKTHATLAARLYDAGCTRGEAESCVSLAMMHGAGMGVPRLLEKTVHYLDKGCTGGHYGACAKLGEMYADGDGVKRDAVMSKAYARRACDGGVPTSCAQLPPGEQTPRPPQGVAP